MRTQVVRAVLAVGMVVCAVFVVFSQSARLGLDLRGGAQIVLETGSGGAEEADRALEVLRKRVDALGLAEPSLTRAGEKRIIVELPEVRDPAEAVAALGKTAQLSAHAVVGTKPADGDVVKTDEDGRPVRLGPALLTGDEIKGAAAGSDPQSLGTWSVSVDFRGNGGDAWAKATGAAACRQGDLRRIAFVLDGKVVSSPQVAAQVGCGTGIMGGSTQITGGFSAEEAQGLAALIEGGALPVPVEIIDQRVVGPSLGAAAIEASAKAAVIGVLLTAVYMMVAYRLAGVLSVVSLLAYALISYAGLVALGATLTLPGLAGFVLAIGMAIDANVLVFERAREEVAAGRTVRVGLHTGFAKAWSAVADSSLTTLLAAGLLFFLASGPVKGFGVTLCLGVLASLFTAMVLTRVLTVAALPRVRPGLTGLAGVGPVRRKIESSEPDLLGRKRIWLTLSAVALAVSVAGLAAKGLNLGVEFTGGRMVEYATSQSADAARENVAKAGWPDAIVQKTETGVSVRTGTLTESQRQVIQQAVGGQVEQDEMIGPSLGDELKRKALVALIVALLAQQIYLAIRFRWTFAAAAVLAMAHDVLIVLGFFAWLGRPVDGVFLAALLTVIGYSVNDSVVVFDRIREAGEPYVLHANRAALQTIPRTVNTGIGAVFILTALAVLGGGSLTDFALALLIGIAVGTWSSVFTAMPLAVLMESRRATRPNPAAVPETG
ncbi:protein translocase subunit SecD [Actinocorallia lasiicapitis]